MQRLLFIYNPHAGRQRAKNMLSDLLTVFAREGFEITVRPTLAPGDAARVAAQQGEGYDRVVCCGGDGTLNETVDGLLSIPSQRRPVLGYVPAGTTNDFARNLDLPKTVRGMAQVACQGVPRAIDVGELGGKRFLYIAAFGLFTDVSYSTPQTSKHILGHMAYVLEGAGRLANVPSYPMEVTSPQGHRVEGEFIYGMVGNTVSVGGMMNLPRDLVRLDDGQFEVFLVRQPKTGKDWQSIFAAFAGQKIPEDGAVVGFSCGEVTFRSSQPVAWTVDGEFGGEHTEVTVVNHPRTLVIACGG